MTNQSTPIINHYTALVSFDDFRDNIEDLEEYAGIIIKNLNFSTVGKTSHSFKPVGKTLIYILSESHLAFHTWPEYKLIHIDLVSCIDLTEKDFHKALKLAFRTTESCKIQVKECSL